MGSHDHHHDHHDEPSDPSRIFKIGIGLNLLFVGIEMYFGVIGNSLALVSDGVHNLTDVFGLTFAWVGYLFSKRAATKKFSIYAAFINTSFILATSFWITFEAYKRYMANETPVAVTMIAVASVGLFINFFTAKLFHKGHHHDLNMKSAYLHLMADAAVSLGVVIAGIVIFYTSLTWMDPLISGIISVIVIITTWSYFRESWLMLTGQKPASINDQDVICSIMKQPEISAVVSIKIWALSTSENALRADIQVLSKLSDDQINHIKHRLYHDFKMTEVFFKQVSNA